MIHHYIHYLIAAINKNFENIYYLAITKIKQLAGYAFICWLVVSKSRHRINMHHGTTEIPTMRPASSGKSFVTLCTYKERQDVLKNTIVRDYKEDIPIAAQQPNSRENTTPCADYSNVKPSNLEPSTELNGNFAYQNLAVTSTKSSRFESQKPPNSPTPDYEPVLVQGTIPKQMQMYSNMQLRNDATITGNRRTMRLGTVTIGEYTQNQQKDPVKFEFLEKKTLKDGKSFAKTEDSSTLRSELQDTLLRSNLRKNTSFTLNESNDGSKFYEHQSHCQLQNNNKEYTNVEKLTRMLQCRQTPTDAPTRPTSAHVIRNQPVANQKVETYSNGILKNGSSSRSSRTSFSKSSEKSISFGN